jgi:hypothetical protein
VKVLKEKRKEGEGDRYEINYFSVEFQREFPQVTADILR